MDLAEIVYNALSMGCPLPMWAKWRPTSRDDLRSVLAYNRLLEPEWIDDVGVLVLTLAEHICVCGAHARDTRRSEKFDGGPEPISYLRPACKFCVSWGDDDEGTNGR